MEHYFYYEKTLTTISLTTSEYIKILLRRLMSMPENYTFLVLVIQSECKAISL